MYAWSKDHAAGALRLLVFNAWVTMARFALSFVVGVVGTRGRVSSILSSTVLRRWSSITAWRCRWPSQYSRRCYFGRAGRHLLIWSLTDANLRHNFVHCLVRTWSQSRICSWNCCRWQRKLLWLLHICELLCTLHGRYVGNLLRQLSGTHGHSLCRKFGEVIFCIGGTISRYFSRLFDGANLSKNFL